MKRVFAFFSSIAILLSLGIMFQLNSFAANSAPTTLRSKTVDLTTSEIDVICYIHNWTQRELVMGGREEYSQGPLTTMITCPHCHYEIKGNTLNRQIVDQRHIAYVTTDYSEWYNAGDSDNDLPYGNNRTVVYGSLNSGAKLTSYKLSWGTYGTRARAYSLSNPITYHYADSGYSTCPDCTGRLTSRLITRQATSYTVDTVNFHETTVLQRYYPNPDPYHAYEYRSVRPECMDTQGVSQLTFDNCTFTGIPSWLSGYIKDSTKL